MTPGAPLALAVAAQTKENAVELVDSIAQPIGRYRLAEFEKRLQSAAKHFELTLNRCKNVAHRNSRQLLADA